MTLYILLNNIYKKYCSVYKFLSIKMSNLCNCIYLLYHNCKLYFYTDSKKNDDIETGNCSIDKKNYLIQQMFAEHWIIEQNTLSSQRNPVTLQVVNNIEKVSEATLQGTTEPKNWTPVVEMLQHNSQTNEIITHSDALSECSTSDTSSISSSSPEPESKSHKSDDDYVFIED